MEFLVEIDVVARNADDREQINALTPAERARGRELQTAGHIVRIWRIPGTAANVGIWSAADPTELHAILQSLPLFPWTSIRVRPLATHDLEMDPNR